MANVIIGGQALSLLLTLLVTPVAYTIFDDMSRIFWKVMRFFGRLFGGKEPDPVKPPRKMEKEAPVTSAH
jgi:HAE1 family hydrophobic/amphiphilic exporter-1